MDVRNFSVLVCIKRPATAQALSAKFNSKAQETAFFGDVATRDALGARCDDGKVAL